MARLKIYLDENESVDEVKDLIAKAFSQDNDIHEHIDEDHRPFPDPTLQDVHKVLNAEFSDMFNRMFKEVETVVTNPHLFDM